jgi:hypothetical protein
MTRTDPERLQPEEDRIGAGIHPDPVACPDVGREPLLELADPLAQDQPP